MGAIRTLPGGKTAKQAAVSHVRDEFQYQIGIARELKVAARRNMQSQATPTNGFTYFQVCRVMELAFMAVCAAWEDFLERSMTRYLLGAKAASGFSPVLRCGRCANLLHAYQVLSGKPDYRSEVDYMTWTNPAQVIRLANVFFVNGEPFNAAMQSCNDALKQAPKIRNRVAHASQSCKADFKKAVNALRQRPKDASIGRGFRVGYLLDEPAGPFFGRSVAAANIPVFEAYLQLFEKLAKAIVPN